MDYNLAQVEQALGYHLNDPEVEGDVILLTRIVWRWLDSIITHRPHGNPSVLEGLAQGLRLGCGAD